MFLSKSNRGREVDSGYAGDMMQNQVGRKFHEVPQSTLKNTERCWSEPLVGEKPGSTASNTA